jgi:predicted small metal-binding protein
MAKEVSCREAGYDCDFMVRSEKEDELIEMVKQHARDVHDMDMSSSDIKGVWRTA